MGSQWHKCRQEGLPNPSSEPYGGTNEIMKELIARSLDV
ncbi:hypothetical protein AKL17_3p0070 (plasmid) [Frigidibacter mobilis]|uniref:Uncharacterized protein n=1 Tax=Frigidibacter mobilis TaxID=1335048 RepID=A0A159Z9G4_9RHOB|nr:hypothetical protein AKL17_3p0070 [Frigidibacter mobilis]